MSSFPNPATYTTAISKAHLQNKAYISPFILKKAKGVYLYDLDQNKYTDFSLNQGLIFDQHSPSSLTTFCKNALSYGFNSMNFAHKFMHKSITAWQKITKKSHIQYYNSLAEMILALSRVQKIQTIGVENSYLLHQIQNLDHLFTIKIINPNEPCDLYCFETGMPSSSLSIQVHHRFLFRAKKTEFSDKTEHFIFSSPFGGQNLGILASDQAIPFSLPNFADGILLLEGAKLFSKYQQKSCPQFKHEQFDSFSGYAICKKNLEQEFFLARGIYLENNTLYFSPQHSQHDIRRLNKALTEYFTQSSSDNLSQK